ncbi:MAG: tetratricopeptide repeat protein [Microcoleus sp. PH2017_10_PVI_O_A]|uniref:J domain-containing protein n=1 Tax=unclassified Microcoleus TaxID=2642155 RepID=UPI001DAF93DC|nr:MULTISPECIES: tetratricopeptide repeat protein [unclassified Microcoleus]TAE78538.1 MAG: molecular chaperone DnaJ [Oscillatoriales cyanobacterium]MCC3408167.1 tetratricopeptide repeat protein [Microcoleus sp. PH2017_10_PVI_O_A]MCC3462857.1 tetratricopeptide repeat protein [Microcoleus sp. PH2017_11_PCY_U_A]MCC3480711.1 tetratricopeptide repeat protein [Microcoleus sp. PH2017_12_PCY_D_A]MCC3530637.1 tetratricopeptide repeat protein [Microcoleus sp. PH2017_21_RUC_O_A]
MSFEMTKGLFKYDFTDQHAILGIPLDAEFNDIRKRYMKIARRLHSDTCSFEDSADKEWANQFLSKVVNPAYNKFSKESDRKEYNLLLTAIAKRVAKEQAKMQVESAAAKELATAKDLEEAYKTAVGKLALKQYESVQETQDAIDQISELNMVYLLRKERLGGVVGTGVRPKEPIGCEVGTTPATAANQTTTVTKAAPTTATKPSTPATATPPPPPKDKPKDDSLADRSCVRAQGFMDSKNYAKATLELKEALKRDPKHSKAHALLAMCYLQQNQATMAKLEVQKALASNPQEATALEVKKKLEQASAKDKKSDEKPGFFASLFGGKKK